MDELAAEYGDAIGAARHRVAELYEETFNHQAFTGRSGGMFGFEGLGCVYWHMVGKLLLAVQENYFQAVDSGADAATVSRLGKLYYRVRKGIGFNKTPEEFGAFPIDPYSHTPKHAGAQQPGMTGQVKEEILTRFGELGIRVGNGQVRIEPSLLRKREFSAGPRKFTYVDVDNADQVLSVPEHSIAFTWCQVPIIYTLDNGTGVNVSFEDGGKESLDSLELPPAHSAEVFARSGRIRRIEANLPAELLFSD